ncbi:unnamed protein product [Amoebophrya sp. A120]|nr:unnamed protein product [Amoebophrya sp. A120]|eukprot:GSA120T00007340001.1
MMKMLDVFDTTTNYKAVCRGRGLLRRMFLLFSLQGAAKIVLATLYTMSPRTVHKECLEDFKDAGNSRRVYSCMYRCADYYVNCFGMMRNSDSSVVGLHAGAQFDRSNFGSYLCKPGCFEAFAAYEKCARMSGVDNRDGNGVRTNQELDALYNNHCAWYDSTKTETVLLLKYGLHMNFMDSHYNQAGEVTEPDMFLIEDQLQTDTAVDNVLGRPLKDGLRRYMQETDNNYYAMLSGGGYEKPAYDYGPSGNFTNSVKITAANFNLAKSNYEFQNSPQAQDNHHGVLMQVRNLSGASEAEALRRFLSFDDWSSHCGDVFTGTANYCKSFVDWALPSSWGHFQQLTYDPNFRILLGFDGAVGTSRLSRAMTHAINADVPCFRIGSSTAPCRFMYTNKLDSTHRITNPLHILGGDHPSFTDKVPVYGITGVMPGQTVRSPAPPTYQYMYAFRPSVASDCVHWMNYFPGKGHALQAGEYVLGTLAGAFYTFEVCLQRCANEAKCTFFVFTNSTSVPECSLRNSTAPSIPMVSDSTKTFVKMTDRCREDTKSGMMDATSLTVLKTTNYNQGLDTNPLFKTAQVARVSTAPYEPVDLFQLDKNQFEVTSNWEVRMGMKNLTARTVPNTVTENDPVYGSARVRGAYSSTDFINVGKGYCTGEGIKGSEEQLAVTYDDCVRSCEDQSIRKNGGFPCIGFISEDTLAMSGGSCVRFFGEGSLVGKQHTGFLGTKWNNLPCQQILITTWGCNQDCFEALCSKGMAKNLGPLFMEGFHNYLAKNWATDPVTGANQWRSTGLTLNHFRINSMQCGFAPTTPESPSETRITMLANAASSGWNVDSFLKHPHKLQFTVHNVKDQATADRIKTLLSAAGAFSFGGQESTGFPVSVQADAARDLVNEVTNMLYAGHHSYQDPGTTGASNLRTHMRNGLYLLEEMVGEKAVGEPGAWDLATGRYSSRKRYQTGPIIQMLAAPLSPGVHNDYNASSAAAMLDYRTGAEFLVKQTVAAPTVADMRKLMNEMQLAQGSDPPAMSLVPTAKKISVYVPLELNFNATLDGTDCTEQKLWQAGGLGYKVLASLYHFLVDDIEYFAKSRTASSYATTSAADGNKPHPDMFKLRSAVCYYRCPARGSLFKKSEVMPESEGNVYMQFMYRLYKNKADYCAVSEDTRWHWTENGTQVGVSTGSDNGVAKLWSDKFGGKESFPGDKHNLWQGTLLQFPQLPLDAFPQFATGAGFFVDIYGNFENGAPPDLNYATMPAHHQRLLQRRFNAMLKRKAATDYDNPSLGALEQIVHYPYHPAHPRFGYAANAEKYTPTQGLHEGDLTHVAPSMAPPVSVGGATTLLLPARNPVYQAFLSNTEAESTELTSENSHGVRFAVALGLTMKNCTSAFIKNQLGPAVRYLVYHHLKEAGKNPALETENLYGQLDRFSYWNPDDDMRAAACSDGRTNMCGRSTPAKSLKLFLQRELSLKHVKVLDGNCGGWLARYRNEPESDRDCSAVCRFSSSVQNTKCVCRENTCSLQFGCFPPNSAGYGGFKHPLFSKSATPFTSDGTEQRNLRMEIVGLNSTEEAFALATLLEYVTKGVELEFQGRLSDTADPQPLDPGFRFVMNTDLGQGVALHTNLNDFFREITGKDGYKSTGTPALLPDPILTANAGSQRLFFSTTTQFLLARHLANPDYYNPSRYYAGFEAPVSTMSEKNVYRVPLGALPASDAQDQHFTPLAALPGGQRQLAHGYDSRGRGYGGMVMFVDGVHQWMEYGQGSYKKFLPPEETFGGPPYSGVRIGGPLAAITVGPPAPPSDQEDGDNFFGLGIGVGIGIFVGVGLCLCGCCFAAFYLFHQHGHAQERVSQLEDHVRATTGDHPPPPPEKKSVVATAIELVTKPVESVSGTVAGVSASRSSQFDGGEMVVVTDPVFVEKKLSVYDDTQSRKSRRSSRANKSMQSVPDDEAGGTAIVPSSSAKPRRSSRRQDAEAAPPRRSSRRESRMKSIQDDADLPGAEEPDAIPAEV